MHWLRILLSAAPLGLAWPEPGGSVPARRHPNPPAAQEGFVYLGHEMDPRTVRNHGGFQPQGAGWEHDEEAFSIDHHYSAGPNGCDLNGSGVSGNWLYEIRATPNMLDDQWPEPYPDGEVFALGGILWKQVRRYARILHSIENTFNLTTWTNNSDYHGRLYEDSALASMCRVSVEFPRALAWGEVGDAQAQWLERPLFHTAERFMDDVALNLVGSLPLDFSSYGVNESFPGSSQGDLSERQVADQRVEHELQHLGPGGEHLDVFIREGRESLQALIEDGHMNQAGCAAWLRPQGPMEKRAEEHQEQPQSDSCCKVAAAFRKEKRRGQQVREVFGISLNEMRQLMAGQFDGLNCALLVARMREKADPNGSLETKGVYIIDEPTEESNLRNCQWAKEMVTPHPTEAIFYADDLWPAEAKLQGGFLPPDGTTAFSASRTFGAAAKRAGAFASKGTQGLAGVVYLVRATPNMLVTNMTVPMVVGGIVWKQVMGWVYVPHNYQPPKDNGTQATGSQIRFMELLNQLSQRDTTLFEHNPDYDTSMNQYTAHGEYINFVNKPAQLLRDFMDAYGDPVGWSGDFPLFQRPARETAVVPAVHSANLLRRVRDILTGPWGSLLTWLTASAALVFPVLGEIVAADRILNAALQGGRVNLLHMLRFTMV
ncbi:hypothetical protein CDD80_5577 [Ophiocordyceps camponoti-rufipedis]|uniref:Enterotoxin n=1 Tax=Ophiocordyceps camponoti-rufipedis TaxID=2004952 RepID=A0A2C5ZIS0_9HYPO|nr:hypothetical protein CDD80_5577 [Ophiocordyceps camponoti-rufipedis]